MRYRALDANGDYTIGHGPQEFLQNVPAAVGQAVKTRLLLEQGEWFLDVTEGTPYQTEILGMGRKATADIAIRERILDTQGVTELVAYNSVYNADDRTFSVSATINTVYGQVQITEIL